MLPVSPIPKTRGPVRSWAGMMFVAGLMGGWLVSCEKREGETGASPTDRPAPAASPAPEPLPAEVTFNEHIQPILSEYCYHCHGPDSGTREPKEHPLRLDREADAFTPRSEGVPVIVKGDPGASLLLKLVKSQKKDTVMPPPASHKTMTPHEIALLEKWVAQGAKYEAHWAFTPIKHPQVPTAGEGFAVNPIDRFIAAKLADHHLTPNPPEDPRRFYRRLSFDTTGLPPSVEETDAFVKRHAEVPQQAVEEAADRLLATPASAEHFTHHWLDAARYADTHGIHFDNYRAIWPYRDWVIRAFQTNLPWDEFTLEQIAGDLLPNHTLDQQVATGFNRCLATTGEGGAVGEEYDAIYAKDRTETTSAVWLGLTTGCAACHDHKFDPISTKEFYSLTAFFRNTPMTALDLNDAAHPPSVFVPIVQDRPRWDQIAAEIVATDKLIAARTEAARGDFETWLANAVIDLSPGLHTGLALHLPLTEADGPLRGIVDGAPQEWPATPVRIDGPLGKAVVVSGQPVDLGDLASFQRKDSVSYGGFIRVEGTPTGAVIARMNPAQSFRGWDIYLEGGRPGGHVIETWDKVANKIMAKDPLPPGTWHHVMVTFDGSTASPHASALYVDGVRQTQQATPRSVGKNIEVAVPLRLGARQDDDAKLNGPVALQDFRFYRRLLTPEEISELSSKTLLRHILSIPVAERTKEQTEALFHHFLATADPPMRELNARLVALKNEQETLRSHGSMSLVMEEKPGAPFAHVLIRGVYSEKGEKVAADTPAILPPMPADAPKNRLGLARWLNDPANPLPARVTMNRTWYYFFGNGIVETTEDFGIMGARPSHPQLLDWLAGEFIDSKWDYRHMLKLIVTSATYQQSGNLTPEKLEKDPGNRLLSRGPRNRLDAEQLRDMALASSGLLSPAIGGPPVKPYQPEGIWEAVAMKESNTSRYQQDRGSALYRRSLYTFWKRSAAPPSMELLNAPTREVFCVRRERTNTPLQALVLLNDPQFLEASRVLATHALENAATFESRLDYLTGRLLDRTMNEEERKIVKTSFDKLFTTFKGKPEDAKQVIATGATPPPEKLDPSELAAWSVIASQILNLDEAVTR